MSFRNIWNNMKNIILRKLLVASVFIIPLFAGNSCNTEKCGCSGDRLDYKRFPMNISEIIYSENGTSAGFNIDYYYTYNFCNPEAMFETYNELIENDHTLIEISGDVFYNCQYVMSQSNSPYNSPYSSFVQYDIFVTSMTPILDGK